MSQTPERATHEDDALVGDQDGHPQSRDESSARQRESSVARAIPAAVLVHDLNNLLAAMGAAAALGSRKASDETSQLFADIERLASDASVLSARLVGAVQERRVAPVEVNAFLRELVRQFARTGARVMIRCQAKKSTICTRRDDLQRVMFNVLVNAREASGDDSPIEVATTDSDEGVHIHVRDAGAGMDGETLASIFEPFFTTKAQGTGLGLASVRSIVLGMGGRVTVETVCGEGTQVTLLLPHDTGNAPR